MGWRRKQWRLTMTTVHSGLAGQTGPLMSSVLFTKQYSSLRHYFDVMIIYELRLQITKTIIRIDNSRQ